MAAIKPPFEIFYDSAGRPADNAKIYIGTEGQNPETAPVSVYWDEAQTIVAKQPLRTIAGAIYRGGNKAQVYGPSRYSIAVKSANDELYAYSASVSNELSSDDINYGSITVTEALDDAIKKVATFADLSTTTAEIGEKVNLIGYSFPGIGGGEFIVTTSSGVVFSDGFIAINGGIAFQRVFDYVCPEYVGAIGNGIADDGAKIQAAIDYAVPRGYCVNGFKKYKSSQKITVPQYRTDPPVSLDFANVTIFINELTYTGTTGSAIEALSPTTSVHVKKFTGPGGGTSTSGLYIVGQGDANHRVDYVTGFGININLYQAYSHTINIGYCQDSEIGVLLTESNANKIYGGRIGGRYTPGSVLTDPTTCLIGVKLVGGSINEIHSNIEYCKRDVGGVCLYDDSEGTLFHGYVEGASEYCLYAVGNYGKFEIISGGNVGPSGVYAENDNIVEIIRQQTNIQEAVSANNSTLTFYTPSKTFSNGLSRISGREGYCEKQITALSDARNEIIYSATLAAPNWSFSALGTASWGAVTAGAVTGYIEAGYKLATQFIFPALAGDSNIYRVNQANRITRVGPINYGLWILVESGDIDILVRILESANGLQSKQTIRLSASDKWVNVAARYMKTSAYAADVLYELQFRTAVGATIRICNTYLVTDADLYFAPTNKFNVIKSNLKGIPVAGNCFENGIRINGVVQNQISTPISSAGQYVLSHGDYPIYIVTGGWTGNLFIEDSISDGHILTIKRDGVAAAGVMQLVPMSTIDGSATPISIASAWTSITLIWSKASAGWLNL